MQKDFDYSDFLPCILTFKRATTTTNTQGVEDKTFNTVFSNIPAAVQPVSDELRESLNRREFYATHIAYLNQELAIRIGDYFVNSQDGLTYIIKSFDLQGGGGMDGTDIVFSILAEIIYT